LLTEILTEKKEQSDEEIIEDFMSKITIESEAKRIFLLIVNSFKVLYPQEWKVYRENLGVIGD